MIVKKKFHFYKVDIIITFLNSCLREKIYCTAHDGWEITSYQGLFCLLSKLSYDRLLGYIQLVKAVVGRCL